MMIKGLDQLLEEYEDSPSVSDITSVDLSLIDDRSHFNTVT